MSTPKSSGARNLVLVLVCLAGVLLAVFWRSFLPGQVLFSNDGPLGAISAAEASLPGTLTGFWQDLNWIGGQVPSASPNFSVAVWLLINSAVVFAKFFVPISLLFLGVCAWAFFRQLGFGFWTGLLGGAAAAFNMNVFSNACWGLPTRAVTLGASFLALAALASRGSGHPWMKAVLAGLAVGLSVMEGFDVGAIFSLYIAAFVIYSAWVEDKGAPAARLTRGVAFLGVVAISAAVMSATTLSTLIGTQIQGVVGTQQDNQSREQRWDQATMWSLPKIETLRVVIPGLFGYRMDTPNGGNYWGAVGQQPGWPEHHQGLARHSGSGEYAGVLVVLIALWGLTCSLRRTQRTYSGQERRFIWFWAGAALVSLLLAYGRHAPFYRIIYALPYFSTIRNPIKFMHPFHMSLLVLFAYGLDGLLRTYVLGNVPKAGAIRATLKSWWAKAPAFDRKWTITTAAAVGVSLLGLLLYSASRRELERSLQTGGFPADLSSAIASFSMKEVLWFVVVFAAAAAALILIISGQFTAARVRWSAALLGVLLLTDLVRANRPWIMYYDYLESYATNPILDKLRQKPYEHRVAARLSPMSPNYLVAEQARSLFTGVAEDWLQHHYQYYNIQSLDIIQMPRMPEMDATYLAELFSPSFSASDFLQPGALAAKLTAHSDAVSQFLWEHFSPEARAALERAAGPGAMADVLESELNRLIRTTSLYEPARFAGVKLSPETQSFLKQDVAGRDRTRFQRLLLEDVYPGEVARRSQLTSFARLWQLTNTRLVLGMAGFLDVVNQEMDPTNRSFHIQAAFDFVPRTSGEAGGTRIEDITTSVRPQGQFALFEFGAALPRAKLFSNWQVLTNDALALRRLADPAFDPRQLVLVANALPASASMAAGVQSTGQVNITSYRPKHLTLAAQASTPSVLLLNDKFDPNWKVTVDGQPAPLLRCNYIMRGVYLPAGQHQVAFRFDPPHWTLYVSLSAIAVGMLLCGVLAFGPRTPESATDAPIGPAPAMANPKSKIQNLK